MTYEDVAKRHQLAIARKTMKMHCIGARIMGGMDHVKAAELLNRKLPEDCDCTGYITSNV